MTRRPLLRRHRGDDRGAIAVEFAIAAPLLVLLFFGVLEVGNLLRDRATVTDASREAARTAAALPRESGFQNSALATINGIIANMTDVPREVPMVRVSLFDEADKEVQFVLVTADSVNLVAAGNTRFKAKLVEPAPSARRFEVTFSAPEPPQ